MDLEQELKDTYAEHLDRLDLPPGDVAVARRTGARLRIHRRLTVVGVVAAAAALAGASLVAGGAQRSDEPASPVGHWREIPRAPLSARAHALGVWTGREVLYLGGERRPCAPIVSCDAPFSESQAARFYGYLRDGAAYDPGTNTWRRIAPAPGHVETGSPAGFAAGRLYIETGSGWFSYSVAQNLWSPFAARWSDGGEGISVVGNVIYGQSRSGRQVVAFDARTSRWTTYPPDTIQPRIGGFSVVGTPDGPALASYDASRPYDVHQGSPAIVDVWDGHGWRRLPRTGQMDRGWVWTGRRLVDPTIGYQDKGDEYRWPKAYPYGGILDPTNGLWSPLPKVLEEQKPGWQAAAEGWPASVGGGAWFVTRGVVYDDATGRAWPLPRPPGARASYAEAVWADGRLVAFGGADYSGQKLTGVTDRAWIYTP